MSWSLSFLTVILSSAGAMAPADDATDGPNMPKKFSDAGCVVRRGHDAITFGNSLSKLVWTKHNDKWRARFYTRRGRDWIEVAEDAGYGLLFPDSGGDGGIHVRNSPENTESYRIPATNTPTILKRSPKEIQIRWEWDLHDSKGRAWTLSNHFEMQRGDRFISESVTFQSPLVPTGGDIRCRLQRAWQCRDLDDAFFNRTVNAISHKGYTVDGAGFLVAITPSNRGGGQGGGLVHREFGWHFSEERPTSKDALFRIMHRVPHRAELDGWLSLREGLRHTLTHRLIFWDGPLQAREAVDYLYQVVPPTKLPLRFSWKAFMDMHVEGRKHELPGEFVDNGIWGCHISEGWYGFTDNCNWEGKEKGAGPFLLPGRPTLDWGGTWDLWTALGMYEYGVRYRDDWCVDRAVKIFNSVKEMRFQIEDPGFWGDGAIWMYAPLTEVGYQTRKNSAFDGSFGWHHDMSPVHKNPQYGFWQSVDTPDCWDLWICDSGKIGYWLCDLGTKLDRSDLLNAGRRAGDFLLSIQKDDGNLKGGRIHITGKTVYDSNLATSGAAVAAWAKLYETTREEKYKTAAIKLTDYAVEHFLNGERWRCRGGEWDGMFDNDVTSASYAAWGFASLYLAARYEPARCAARRAANWIVVNQSIRNTGFRQFDSYKATFLGRDAHTTGGIYQGQKPGAGYSQIQQVRPELPWACYLTYKATGDTLYLDAAMAYLVWQQYLTHTDKRDWRFYGMVSEGLELTIDWMNGFGCTYTAGAFGTDVTLLALMDDGVLQ